MSKQETIMILAMLGAFYSGGKNDARMQADAWHLILQKYDFEIARKAVLDFAENDTRSYASFPAVGVIVQKIREQQIQEKKPVTEIIRGVLYGKRYEDLSEHAKKIISEPLYGEWLKVDAEEFASEADEYADILRTKKLMIAYEQQTQR